MKEEKKIIYSYDRSKYQKKKKKIGGVTTLFILQIYAGWAFKMEKKI